MSRRSKKQAVAQAYDARAARRRARKQDREEKNAARAQMLEKANKRHRTL